MKENSQKKIQFLQKQIESYFIGIVAVGVGIVFLADYRNHTIHNTEQNYEIYKPSTSAKQQL